MSVFWREECPDRPRHTEALTVTFVLSRGKISQQARKAPQTIFQNSPDLSHKMLDAIYKLRQCHLSLCSQSACCLYPAVIFIFTVRDVTSMKQVSVTEPSWPLL